MTAESTELPSRNRLAAAWARTYGAGRTATQIQEVGDESRAMADARAAWRRWHDGDLDGRWSAAEWPWFEALERARVEQLASEHLPGIARNLSDSRKTAPSSQSVGYLYRSARNVFAGFDSLPDGAVLGSASGKGLYQRLRQWLTRGRLPMTESAVASTLRNARELLGCPAEFADEIKPLVAVLAELEMVATDSAAYLNPAASATSLTIADGECNETEDENADEIAKVGGDAVDEPDLLRDYPDYRIYSTAWDEGGPAAQWLCPQDAELLNSLLSPDRRQIRRLAHNLQRRLQAASLRRWQFDQDEGLLDSRRLSRLVSERANRRVFRHEEICPVPSACVCFLVDLSGSMRGERQRIAAMTVDLAVHTLELCGIRSEVLGYTTPFGADNPVAEHWKRNGSTDKPGRLNAVRHIVFKTVYQPWRRARKSLGLMLREDFGRENIDGEALHWAAKELVRRHESKKILLVLCDGSPYDEATIAANGSDFLESSLRRVTAAVENSPLQLAAIGSSSDVCRFFSVAKTASSPDLLAEALFQAIGDLITPERGSRKKP